MDKKNGNGETPEVQPKNFWKYVKKVAKRAGKELIINALTLWYCWNDEDTAIWAKTTILGALAYFILPTDIIPDFLIPFGFVDDAAVLLAALKAVSTQIKPEHRKRAREWWDEFFG